MSTVIIKRTNEYVNRFRNCHLYIDGKKAGTIANGQTVALELSPGTHVLCAKIDWCSSPEVPFTAIEGATTTFEIGGFKNSNVFILLILALVAGNFIAKEIFSFSYLEYLFMPLLVGMAILLIFGRNKYLRLNHISQ